MNIYDTSTRKTSKSNIKWAQTLESVFTCPREGQYLSIPGVSVGTSFGSRIEVLLHQDCIVEGLIVFYISHTM